MWVDVSPKPLRLTEYELIEKSLLIGGVSKLYYGKDEKVKYLAYLCDGYYMYKIEKEVKSIHAGKCWIAKNKKSYKSYVKAYSTLINRG